MQIDSDFVLDAVNTVLSWDLPDEAYPEAVSAQVCQLAGVDSEQRWDYDVDITVH
jgi:hypothetical protein